MEDQLIGDRVETQTAGIIYRPFLFWCGALLVALGVCLHIPMFIHSSGMHYQMVGMQVDTTMLFGMVGIGIGTIISAYGLYPRRTPLPAASEHEVALHIQAMEDGPLSKAHWQLFMVLVVALVIDVMKPATLGFVVPGMASEYGLTKREVAILPFVALVGTTVGSILWGVIGDMYGRRASILLAAIIFIGTSICGAMPSFSWNVLMCFVMGMGAGGLLPIAFALLTETVPKRQRGWLGVLLGGFGTIGGYLCASGGAVLLEPHFGWRILWFLGLPTGLMLVGLNRYIPESPRYLAHHGRMDEAVRVLRRFGASLVPERSNERAGKPPMQVHGIEQIFRRPYVALIATLGLCGLAWGLVNFGFLLWLPRDLRAMGYGVGSSDRVLAQSALVAFPVAILVAWLCYSWSTKKTMALFAALSAVTLFGFAWFGDRIGTHPLLLMVLLVALLSTSSAVIAMLIPYSSEVFPGHLRATGTGLAAGSSKAGGVLALAIALFSMVPSIGTAAFIVAVPIALSALLIARNGLETRGVRLEEIGRRSPVRSA